jgi:gliding motility-associated-like protein
MKAEFEQYELIEQYLKGELSGSERSAVESRLATDALFSEEVKHHQAVHDLVMDHGLLELKAKMKAYDPGYAGGANKLHIVSTVVLVVSLTAMGLMTSSNNSIEPPAQSAVVTIAPNANRNKPAVVDQVKKTREPLSAIIPAPAQPAPAPDAVAATVDTVHTTPQPLIFSRDTATIKKSFSGDVRQPSDIIPEMKSTLLLKPLEAKTPGLIPCQLESSVLTFSASESCTSSPTGVISVDRSSLFEGKLPVEFSIDGKNYYTAYTFNNLYPGIYYLSVRDARGCTWPEAKEIVVGEKDCNAHEYSFYPDKGEVWKLPVSISSSGKIDIYNRNGSLVYTSVISHGHPDQWDGTAHGHVLPMGSYSFVLKVDEKTITGQVTIFR